MLPVRPKKMIEGREHYLFGRNLEAAQTFSTEIYFEAGANSDVIVTYGGFFHVVIR